MLRSPWRLLSSGNPCTGRCFVADPRHLLEDVLILQLPNDIRRGDARDKPRFKIGRAPYPSLALLFHCAYVSGSFYLPTRGVLNIAGIPTLLPDSRGPLADLECVHMPIELNCPASLYPLTLTAEDIPDRHLSVLGVLGIAGVTSCVPVAGPSTPSSPVILI